MQCAAYYSWLMPLVGVLVLLGLLVYCLRFPVSKSATVRIAVFHVQMLHIIA